MKFKLCLTAFFVSFSLLHAQDYKSLLDLFEKQNKYLKRKKIVNDNYVCIEYFSNGEELPHRNQLRLGKLGKTKVLLKFRNSPWHRSKLRKLDRATYGNESLLIRRIRSGRLLLKSSSSLLDCQFPKRDDDWDW